MLAYLPRDAQWWVTLEFPGGIVSIVIAATFFWTMATRWKTAPKRTVALAGALGLAFSLYAVTLAWPFYVDELRRRAGIHEAAGCAAGQAVGFILVFHAAAWGVSVLSGTIVRDVVVSRTRAAARRLNAAGGTSAA
jgi:hypothetical protein